MTFKMNITNISFISISLILLIYILNNLLPTKSDLEQFKSKKINSTLEQFNSDILITN